MQMEFTAPDFIDENSPEDIHERMMDNLPADIDDTPGGFPSDFTLPAAIEKSDFIQYYLVRALKIAFPQFAWDEWLDYHGKQVNLTRHPASRASGQLLITGEAGTEIEAETIFCVPATEYTPAIEYSTDEDCTIGEDGTVLVPITAVEEGFESNVKANSISIMDEPMDEITAITNPQAIFGGTERESNDDYYDRIAAEYENSKTYLGNDGDYRRWAMEAGAGDCIVDACYDGPGTVKLVLIDTNGQPANEKLLADVYNHIVSPNDRTNRLLPTACAKLSCVAAISLSINYRVTGLLLSETTSIGLVIKEFEKALKPIYAEAKQEGILRYNDIRPIISDIDGVEDFNEFLVNEGMVNIHLKSEEYPETGTCDFIEGDGNA